MALPIIPRGEMPPEDRAHFFKFVCPPADGGDNPDPQPPDVIHRRDLLETLDLDLPDGEKLRMWVFGDPDDPEGGRQFPGKTLRIPLNAVARIETGAKGDPHTIHWHGIEPTPINDGVGKNSFEINGNFPYQFQPREAGTYFYHCHVNTALHFEMGLYGLLIVDPPHPQLGAVTYPDGGPGYAVAFSPFTGHVIPYDVEAFWVADDIDSRWHSLGHMAFMQDCDRDDPMNPAGFTQDGILNDFRLDIFALSGVLRRVADPTPFTPANSPALVAPTVGVGKNLLIRAVNAAYATAEFVLGLDADVIAMGGHALGVPPFQQYSRPFRVAAGTPFRLTSAMRRDLLIRPLAAGSFPGEIRLLHSVTGDLLYTAHTTITVTG